MIKGYTVNKKDDLRNMLEDMDSSAFLFILTGSRTWKNALLLEMEDTTDWDFFVKYEVHSYDFLETRDFFRVVPESSYSEIDPTVHCVFRKVFDNGNHIDVQLIYDNWMERKILTNEVYKKIAPSVSFNKETWKIWWRTMLESFPKEEKKKDDFGRAVDCVKFLASNKIHTIKALREIYGLGLVEAKDRMDMLCEGAISNDRVNNYRKEKVPFFRD